LSFRQADYQGQAQTGNNLIQMKAGWNIGWQADIDWERQSGKLGNNQERLKAS